MTSPQAITSEVVAAMATTGVDDRPPNIELTAGDEHAQAEVKANIKVEKGPCAGTVSLEENKDKESEFVGEDGAGQDEELRLRERAVVPVEGADPIQEQEQEPELELPPHMLDYSQMDPIASLLAYAQPYDVLPQRAMNDIAPALPLPADGSIVQQPYLDPSPYIHENDETRISAYAKLEFQDGEFYMNTYQVILGRDQRAARDALRREQEERRRIDEEASANREPKTPVRIKREESRYSRSVISESGGILREGDDPPPAAEREERRRRRKASKKSKSTGSSSHHPSRRNSLAQPNGVFDYQPQTQARRYAPETAGAAPVDPASLRPSPHDCPLVGIHPPATTPASGHKAISREHVKIAYNLKKHLFEATILGRNGAFIDEEFCYHKNVIPLKSGSRLQIGGVVVRFVLPDVAIGETGAEHRAEYDDNPMSERYSEGGKEMSFDFEDTFREGVVEDTSEDSSNKDAQDGEGGEEEDEGAAIGEEVDDEGELENTDQSQLGEDDEAEGVDGSAEILPEESPKSQKKRGPGRPPKNGIMSKREEQLAKKEAAALAAHAAQNQTQQRAKKTVPQTGPTPGKNKVGRPRKHPRPDTPPVQREKRKYTKRKPKEPKEGEVKEEGSGGEEIKEKKEKKPPKPPRSPSPQFNEADLTPEQLAKPQANYVTLIHEALSNSPAGQMSLPQIYRAIMRKYPFFVLKCNTNGWQSSVRHNLSQHHAFKKVERDGKGWMWAIVEGVSIEKEKKRRTTPPPQLPPGHMHHQPIYQAGHPPHMMPGPYGPGPMAPPPGYPINHPMHPNIRPGQHPQYMGPPPPMNGHPYPPGPHPQMDGQPHPQGFVASIPQLAPPAGPQQYSSPYAPKPASSAAPQPQSNEHRPLPDQNPPAPSPPSSTAPQQPPQHQQPQPPQQPQQQKPTIVPAGRPKHPESVLGAVETFRTVLVSSFKDKSNNAEAVVASAVNRVLGYMHQSTVPGDPHEEQIMDALTSVLGKIPEFNVTPHLAPAQPPNQQNDQRLPQTQTQTNQDGTQRNASQQPPKLSGSEKSAPAVMRPFFTGGPSRPNGPSVPRPPMMTPGMKRTSSGSPANAPPRPSGPSSASPAPAPSSTNGAPNGASTPIMSASESGQIAGQKRPLDDADDMREFKRMSNSGPPQLKI